MIEVTALAAQVAGLLAPAVPVLLGKVADGVGNEVRKDSLDAAQAIWARIRPRLDAKPATREAVEDIADNPKDADAQAALRVQLRKLLADDPELQAELTQIVREAHTQGTSIKVEASGERSVAIGGSNSGVIETGDRAGRRPENR
jgi:hypothetical protein